MGEKTENSDDAGKLPDFTHGWGVETFTLKHPGVFKGGAIREIKVRTPTGADIEAYVRSPERGFRVLALKLADIPEPVLDAMHGSDYARLMGLMGDFVAGTR